MSISERRESIDWQRSETLRYQTFNSFDIPGSLSTMSSEPPRFLLLLPPAPSQVTAQSLKSAFGETIGQVLKEVASQSSQSSKAAILEIALACPHLIGKRRALRSSLYTQTQSLVAGVYRLITTVAAKEGVNVEDVDGADARILLVAWSPNDAEGHDERQDYPYGIIGTLESLAKSGRGWQYAFGHESNDGEAMVKAFLAAKGTSEEVVRVGSEDNTDQTTSSRANPAQDSATTSINKPNENPHHHVAVGGTFDHIHIGHKLLLTMTIFAVDEPPTNSTQEFTATIGITGDQLLKQKKYGDFLESWEERYRAVITFINAILDFSPPSSAGQRHVSIRDDPGPNGKSMDVSYPNGLVVKCTEIQDAFGPTITEEQISALVLSAETRAGGKAVNDKREEKGWKPLDIMEVDILDAEEEAGSGKVEGFESKLSSTAIREKLAKKRQSSL